MGHGRAGKPPRRFASGKACAMAAPDDDTEWVLPEVAAERLGVVKSTVVARIRRGDLEGRKNERGHWVVRLPVLAAIAAPATRRAALSAEEAVAMTGVRPRELWTAVYQRRLRVLRRGADLRFDPGELTAWIETQRLPPGRKGDRSRPVTAEAGEELLTLEAAAARLGWRRRRCGDGSTLPGCRSCSPPACASAPCATCGWRTSSASPISAG